MSKGYYIGYKLSLAIEHPSLRPVAFLLHQGSPNDAKIYEKILEELRRKRIARNGDTSLHVLLIGIVVSLGINSKEELQRIAEW
ncbi:MAG: hypothetical protein ACXQTS_03550 [Candidatus Methanospirareceae archaeon]